MFIYCSIALNEQRWIYSTNTAKHRLAATVPKRTSLASILRKRPCSIPPPRQRPEEQQPCASERLHLKRQLCTTTNTGPLLSANRYFQQSLPCTLLPGDCVCNSAVQAAYSRFTCTRFGAGLPIDGTTHDPYIYMALLPEWNLYRG